MIPDGPQHPDTPLNRHGRRNRLSALLCAGLVFTQAMNGAEAWEGFAFAEAPEPVEMQTGPLTGPAGTLSFHFVLDGIETTLALPHRAAGRGYTEGTLAQLPFGRAWLFFGAGGGGLNLAWENAAGENLLAQMSLSRLKGGQPYHLAIAWDFEKDLLRMWLNGVDQGDLLHSRAGSEIAPAALTETLKVGGELRYEGETAARIGIARAAGFDRALDDEEVRELADGISLPPLEGEGRTLFHEPMRLEGVQKELVYATDFCGAETWVHESDLIDASGARKEAPPEGVWILEGDAVERRTAPDGVHFVSGAPEDGRNGAWVFWLNRELPENYLIEYAFTPERSDRGLNILFFNARGRDGGSVFDLSQPTRHGWFRSYIVGDIDNYHVSPWATDGTVLRRTANLRKNSGFRLLAAGNDRMARPGRETHLVRLARMGNRIELESDGIVALRHEDDGSAYGPALTGGIAGLRFMAHTGSATVHYFRIYRITKVEPSHETN